VVPISSASGVHPSVVGRRVELTADLERVRAWCNGRLVADHQRCWARHQTISDPDHVTAARALRAEYRSAGDDEPTEVELRCLADYDTAFGLDDEGVADAHHQGTLQAELARLGRYPLLVVDEVGYIPFEPGAANLFFQLVSARYERASLIVTSNKPFGRWGDVFGDDVVAAAMIDRLVHHADVVALKAIPTGSKTETSAASPRPPPRNHDDQGGQLSPAARWSASPAADTEGKRSPGVQSIALFATSCRCSCTISSGRLAAALR
jgi:hypothetical protein